MPYWIETPHPISLPIPVPAVPVPHIRSIAQIEYEKALVIRDYYKNRLEKTKNVHGVMATKDVEELTMNLQVSELDLEKAEINLGTNLN